MRKDRYVVGYQGAGNVVYGKQFRFTEPLTAFQAHGTLKKMPCKGAVIFKLVPVKRVTR